MKRITAITLLFSFFVNLAVTPAQATDAVRPTISGSFLFTQEALMGLHVFNRTHYVRPGREFLHQSGVISAARSPAAHTFRFTTSQWRHLKDLVRGIETDRKLRGLILRPIIHFGVARTDDSGYTVALDDQWRLSGVPETVIVEVWGAVATVLGLSHHEEARKFALTHELHHQLFRWEQGRRRLAAYHEHVWGADLAGSVAFAEFLQAVVRTWGGPRKGKQRPLEEIVAWLTEEFLVQAITSSDVQILLDELSSRMSNGLPESVRQRIMEQVVYLSKVYFLLTRPLRPGDVEKVLGNTPDPTVGYPPLHRRELLIAQSKGNTPLAALGNLSMPSPQAEPTGITRVRVVEPSKRFVRHRRARAPRLLPMIVAVALTGGMIGRPVLKAELLSPHTAATIAATLAGKAQKNEQKGPRILGPSDEEAMRAMKAELQAYISEYLNVVAAVRPPGKPNPTTLKEQENFERARKFSMKRAFELTEGILITNPEGLKGMHLPASFMESYRDWKAKKDRQPEEDDRDAHAGGKTRGSALGEARPTRSGPATPWSSSLFASNSTGNGISDGRAQAPRTDSAPQADRRKDQLRQLQSDLKNVWPSVLKQYPVGPGKDSSEAGRHRANAARELERSIKIQMYELMKQMGRDELKDWTPKLDWKGYDKHQTEKGRTPKRRLSSSMVRMARNVLFVSVPMPLGAAGTDLASVYPGGMVLAVAVAIIVSLGAVGLVAIGIRTAKLFVGLADPEIPFDRKKAQLQQFDLAVLRLLEFPHDDAPLQYAVNRLQDYIQRHPINGQAAKFPFRGIDIETLDLLFARYPEIAIRYNAPLRDIFSDYPAQRNTVPALILGIRRALEDGQPVSLSDVSMLGTYGRPSDLQAIGRLIGEMHTFQGSASHIEIVGRIIARDPRNPASIAYAQGLPPHFRVAIERQIESTQHPLKRWSRRLARWAIKVSVLFSLIDPFDSPLQRRALHSAA